MTNFIQKGEILDYTNTTTEEILSGDLVICGSLVGVAETDIPVGERASVLLKGVYRFDKVPGAVSQGDKLYYATENQKLTETAEGNTYVGVAFRAALTGDTTVDILLTNGI